MEKLQYISQGNTKEEQIVNIKKALDNGVKWVQLRSKTIPNHELAKLGELTRQLCNTYQSIYIVNDHVELANETDADGIHLGLQDTPIYQARLIFGNNKIIGGTANTMEDVQQRIAEGCDYIGLGPLRYTTTKEKLSPILGLNGYKEIIGNLKAKSTDIPKLFAIGAIQLEDVSPLLNIGIYGVAISGLITTQPTLTHELKKLMA